MVTATWDNVDGVTDKPGSPGALTASQGTVTVSLSGNTTKTDLDFNDLNAGMAVLAAGRACTGGVFSPIGTPGSTSINITPTAVTAGTVTGAVTSSEVSNLPIPTWADITLNTNYAVPSLADLITIDTSMPSVDLHIPSAPTALTTQFTETVPDIDVPTIPDYTPPPIPDELTFSPILIDEPPAYQLLQFDEPIPEDQLGKLDINYQYSEPALNLAILDYVEAMLNTQSNGINSGLEDRMWNRTVDRQRDAGAAFATVADEFSRVFNKALPAGAAAQMVASAQETGRLLAADTGAAITLRKEAMNQSQRKFVWQKAVEVERDELQTYNAKMTRMLTQAKLMAKAGMDTFEANLTMFRARVDAYNIMSQIFATKINAATQKLELFRTKLQTSKMRADLKRTEIDTYEAQIQGLQAMVGAYKARMQAAQIEADVQRAQIEAFRTSVDAFTAKVNAKALEGKVFEAQVRGEVAKVNVYKAQVDAYNAVVSAYKGKAQASGIALQAYAEKAETQLDLYRTLVAGYKTKLDTAVANHGFTAGLAKVAQQVVTGQKTVDALANHVNSDNYKHSASAAIDIADVAREHAVKIMDLNAQYASLYSRVKIQCAELATKRAAEGSRIASRQSVAVTDIHAQEAISYSNNVALSKITANDTQAKEAAAKIALNAQWVQAINRINADEYAGIGSIANQWNSDYVHSAIAVAKADNARWISETVITVANNL